MIPGEDKHLRKIQEAASDYVYARRCPEFAAHNGGPENLYKVLEKAELDYAAFLRDSTE